MHDSISAPGIRDLERTLLILSALLCGNIQEVFYGLGYVGLVCRYARFSGR